MNKAPDKIYVTIPTRRLSDSANYVGIAFSDKSYLTTPQIEEYIRKDALLEWLEGKMTIEGATEGFVGGYDTALKDVIDKLNSMRNGSTS